MGEDINTLTYRSSKAIEHYSKNTYITGIEKKIIKKYFRGKILDLGCGCGRTTKYISDQKFDVVGVDITTELICKGKELYPELDLRAGDAVRLEFDSKTFDIVFFSFNGLDYIYPEERRLLALREMARVTKKEGFVIFSSHNIKTIILRPKFILRNLIKRKLFSKYKSCAVSFGELNTHYDSPKNIVKSVLENTNLKFVELARTGLFDPYPHFIFQSI
jgi:ubiquinone/menaquinone biosynthesis C-methylase UbiE